MNAPRYLNLLKIALPLAGISSILHRISAVGIFVLSLPMTILLVFSLASSDNFEQTVLFFENIIFKVLFFLFILGIFYHFVSGIRHLIMDFGYWETLSAGRASAMATFVLTGLFSFYLLYLLW
tara:strand:- start:3 stop:371 length:369 start_codon:yes stop_codon:yes gene_type:complete